MNKNISQQGSAHAVIIIVLILGLVTALGWIFYQNFIYKQIVKEPESSVNGKSDNEQDSQTASFKGTYFTINRPVDSELTNEAYEGVAEYVGFSRLGPESYLSASVTVYKDRYDNASEGIPVTHSYVPVAEWYEQQGGETAGGSDGDFLLQHNYKLTRERGQTNRAVIYVLNDNVLYKIVLQESDDVVFRSVDSSDGPTKNSATYEFSKEIKQILASFKVLEG